MEYTMKEYKDILKPQAKAIEEFIKNEIQPYLTKEIEIPFGNIVHRGRYNEVKEHEFTLYVRKDKVFGKIGGLTVYFDIPEYFKNTCCCIDIYNDYRYGGSFIYNLCLRWQSIKHKLLSEIDSQKRSRDMVLKEFTI